MLVELLNEINTAYHHIEYRQKKFMMFYSIGFVKENLVGIMVIIIKMKKEIEYESLILISVISLKGLCDIEI